LRQNAPNTHGVGRGKSFIKTFLLLFVPSTLFFVTIIASYQKLIIKNDTNELLLKEEARLQLVANASGRLFRNIITDLLILSEKENLIKVIRNRKKLINRVLVAREFAIFSRRKASYDQIRYIDETGMEVVRVDFNDGDPKIIPFNRLQDKSHRYYFTATKKLKKAEVYVSPMELNIEYTRVEKPVKPMIRFITPVFNTTGDYRGIIVLNYFGEDLLELVDSLLESGSGRPVLIDNRGGILHGQPQDASHLIYKDYRTNFANIDLITWEALNSSNHGRIEKEDGIYVFTTIYPLRDALSLNKRRKGLHIAAPFNPRANSYHWKMISFMPENSLKKVQREGPLVFMMLYVVVVLANAAFCRSLVGYRIRKHHTVEKLRNLATKDALTGLWNRRSLFEHGADHIKHAEKSGSKLSVIMVDADHFKKVNDTYGHAAGDKVLKELASRLFSAVRSIDVAARYGGEEFTVLSPRTDLNGAINLAERIREAMEAELFDIGQKKIPVTVSVGVAELDGKNGTLQSVIEKADKALYRAKMTGRNRVSY